MTTQFNASEILSSTSQSQAPVEGEQGGQGEGNERPRTEQSNPGTDGFDAKFQALAKMERKMREERTQHSTKNKEWEEKDLKLKEYQEFMDLMETNPLEAIKKKKGWGLKEINDYAVQNLGDDEMDPVSQMTNQFKTQMAEMEKRLTDQYEEKLKAKEEEIMKKDYDRQIEVFKTEVKSFVSENKDTYEYILAEDGGQDLVYDVIYTDLMQQKESGANELKLMDTKEAADKVESYLENNHQKYLGLNKVKSKFNTSREDQDLSRFLPQSAPKTLNNSFSPKSKSLDESDPEERKKAAEALVRSWLGNGNS